MHRKKSLAKVFLDSLKEAAIDCIGQCFTMPKTTRSFISEIAHTDDATTGYVTKKKIETTWSKEKIGNVSYVVKRKKSDAGDIIGKIMVYDLADYTAFKQSEANGVKIDIDPIGILVNGEIKTD